MRCLCYAKFLPNGSISPGEFFAHVGTKWSCVEDTPNPLVNTSNLDNVRNRSLPKSIVFITDCQSLKQLTSNIAKLPGAGISCLEIFPVPGVLEYQ